jgi:hypothetical protein
MKPKKWMTAGLLFFCLFVWLRPQSSTSSRSVDVGLDQALLKAEAAVSPRRLSRSQEGKVILTFTLQEGILISSQPSFTVEFAPSDELVFPKNFFSATDLEIAILEVDGVTYLDLENPIEIPFTVGTEVSRGNYILEGKVKFFAFSRKDGAIVKTSSKFEAAFYARGL